MAISYIILERQLLRALNRALQVWAKSDEELEDACVDWIGKFCPETLAPSFYKNREAIKSRVLKGQKLGPPNIRYRIKWGDNPEKIADVERVM